MELSLTLGKIMADRQSHAMWLNSLSYLEYRGFRKIVRSQKTSDMSLERLLHSMEEVRHAVFFKKQAIKWGGNLFEFYRDEVLLGGISTKKYFCSLDSGVSEQLKAIENSSISNTAYCIVTWLVEQRALSIYTIYDRLLQASREDFSLTSILREENAHLKEMVVSSIQMIQKYGLTLQTLEQVEEEAFKDFWLSIESAVAF